MKTPALMVLGTGWAALVGVITRITYLINTSQFHFVFAPYELH